MLILADGHSVLRAIVHMLDHDHEGLRGGEIHQLCSVELPVTVLCQTRSTWKPQAEIQVCQTSLKQTSAQKHLHHCHHLLLSSRCNSS